MSQSAPLTAKVVLWHLCDIISTELQLGNGQVMLYNQKKNIPPTSGLWVTVGLLSLKPFGSSTRVDGSIEYQSVNMSAIASIDIMSRDDSALNRKEEIIMAFGSTYAQSIQEQQSFKIGRLPTAFVNISEIEGDAIPFRFNISVQIQYMVHKSKSVSYYDQFNHTVVVE